MNKDLTAYSLDGWNCPDVYENNKHFHVNPNYTPYGDVLVETKEIISGFSLRVKLYFRNHWYWKPHYNFKYGNYYFHWLFFMIWFESVSVTKVHKVIKDHLAEIKALNKNENLHL